MVMVYAGGQFSGGHYNPAVTLTELVRRRITAAQDHTARCSRILYLVAQVIGGVTAGITFLALNPDDK